MFLFCNEDKKKKERLNSVLKTTHNLIKKNDIKDCLLYTSPSPRDA